MPLIQVFPYHGLSGLDVLLREHLNEETTFIVPSRRDRDWWRGRTGAREFGLNAERRGHLWNWEDLYDDVSGFVGLARQRQIDPPDHRLILFHIVESFLREERELANRWPGLARGGFIDILSDDIRELINEDVSVEQLEFAAEHDNSTSRILSRLYRRYLDYLSDNGLMDSAQIPQRARKIVETAGSAWGGGRNFAFVGFMSFTHSQLGLVRGIDAVCRRAIVFKPEAELRDFQDATTQLETLEVSVSPSSGRIVSLGASEFSLEPEAVARELALWHAGAGFLATLPDNPFPGFGAMGMMVPERRGAAMEAALRRYRVPFTLARGRSIGRTLPGTLLSPIWVAWIQGLEPWETALVLAHPCLAGGEFSVDEALAAGPRGVREWESWLKNREKDGARGGANRKKSARRALRAFMATVKFCRAMEKGSTPLGIFTALHDFLTTSGLWLDALASMSFSSPDLDENLRELASSTAEVDAKRLALRELQPDLGAAGRVVLKGGEALDFLMDWCGDTLVRPGPPIGGAVTLYSAPPVLASHPVWIMIDVTQKNWPGVQSSSPLLDAGERERMRAASAWLPSAHDRRVQKEALFRRLMQTGDDLTIVSHSATDEEGRPSGRTSLLDSFIGDMSLWELISAPVVEISDLTPADGDAYFPSIEVPLSERAERGAPVARLGVERPRLSVSDLYELLDCPFRWWLRRNAKLRERRTTLLNGAEAGELTHKIWQNVWRRRATEEGMMEKGSMREDSASMKDFPYPSLSVLASGEWQRALRGEEDYEPFRRILFDRRLRRSLKNLEFYVLRLAGVQQDILDRLAASGIGHRMLYMEEELSLSLETDGVVFTGRCDRVELLNKNSDAGRSGQVVILDYKLGKSAAYEKLLPRLSSRRYLPADLLEDREAFRYGLQLSAYALMYGRQFPEHRVTGVGFLGHRDGGLAGTFATATPGVSACYLPGRKAPDKKDDPLEERVAEAGTALRCAAAILKSGRYEPCYVADSCRYCDMKGVCRRGELRGEASEESEEGEEWSMEGRDGTEDGDGQLDD
ncbi:MAG: PD-(D/E)XK nuclease family protein [Synergistaceae bacterium]|nr:PD-(D/E)XK nuclease family protein [Synergistaceae bacterium]